MVMDIMPAHQSVNTSMEQFLANIPVSTGKKYQNTF